MEATAPTGILLVNLGTPDAPRPREVRRYLREFLGDPRVMDLNPVGRWLLLNLVILPFRPRQSAEAYAKIWTDEGSPLLVHGRALAAGLAARLPGCPVELGMRYGNPSIAGALDRLHDRGCDRVVLVPLYPQYSSSATGSTVEATYRAAASRWNTPFLTVVPPFYDAPGFIEAWAAVGGPHWREFRPDHVLFSFHGLPERQVRRSDESGRHCLAAPDCCAAIGPVNRNCYRAQCYATARALSVRLGIPAERSTVAFQSRLGRTPWIRPYMDEVVPDLARRGVRRLLVFSPAFVADCLETLEEIGIRTRESFLEAGGEELRLVPSLNAEPVWIDAVADLVRDAAGRLG